MPMDHVAQQPAAQPNWIQYAFDKVYTLSELWVWNSNQAIESLIGFGAKERQGGVLDRWHDLDRTARRAAVRPGHRPGAPTPPTRRSTSAACSAQYVKLTILSSWGGLPTGRSERSAVLLCPGSGAQPQPASAATGVTSGRHVELGAGTAKPPSHKVYFGTDANSVAQGTAAAQTVTDPRFSPASLLFGTTYYWKVDEVNDAGDHQVLGGRRLELHHDQPYLVVDDFESYNDNDNRIYDTWIDGLTDGKSGSQVGYNAAPFAEQTILHGGKQSMPLDYNNTKSPYYSEAERTWDQSQDWTVHGADTLTLYFRGNPPGFVEASSGTLTMSGAGTDIWNSADQFRFAYKRFTGNGTIVAKVESVGNTDPWAKAGVMIRESLDPGARFAAVYATPGNGVRYQARLLAANAATSDTTVATAEQMALQDARLDQDRQVGQQFQRLLLDRRREMDRDVLEPADDRHDRLDLHRSGGHQPQRHGHDDGPVLERRHDRHRHRIVAGAGDRRGSARQRRGAAVRDRAGQCRQEHEDRPSRPGGHELGHLADMAHPAQSVQRRRGQADRCEEDDHWRGRPGQPETGRRRPDLCRRHHRRPSGQSVG